MGRSPLTARQTKVSRNCSGTICESCTFFVPTIEFRPTLLKQRDDAERKGQVGRQKIFDGLLTRLDNQEEAS